MPEMTQPPMNAPANPVVLDAARWDEPLDFALGCECADPSLQIEQWGAEIASGATATH